MVGMYPWVGIPRVYHGGYASLGIYRRVYHGGYASPGMYTRFTVGHAKRASPPTRFTVGHAERASPTRFTVGLWEKEPFRHPFHCWSLGERTSQDPGGIPWYMPPYYTPRYMPPYHPL